MHRLQQPTIRPRTMAQLQSVQDNGRKTRPAHSRRQQDASSALVTSAESATLSTPEITDVGSPPARKGIIPARSAAAWHTVPSPATEVHQISTPLQADEWEEALRKANVYEEFSDVVAGLHNGFRMAPAFAPLKHTFSPPNHRSSTDAPHVISAHIQDELSKRRYVGPFSRHTLQSLIGPFRFSPLGIVPKPNSSELRIIQDFSYPLHDPHNTSVNSEINPEDFPCEWGFFQDIATIVADAKPGTQAATFDVDAAYRNIPVHPSDRAHTVVMWEDLFYVDLNVPFGATSSGGIFGRVADALVTILAAKGIGPIKKWVDNFVFFRTPIPSMNPPAFAYNEESIYQIGTTFGLPWKKKKTRPFSNTFIYLGFLWDIQARTVAIPEPKKAKYLDRLKLFAEGNRASRELAEKVLGTLVHCALAVPTGRSRLPSFASYTASFGYLDNPHALRTIPTPVRDDIAWWSQTLSTPFCGSRISTPPPPVDLDFWVDASTSFGIGIILQGEWCNFQLLPGWKTRGRDIGWAEMVAVELGILWLVAQGVSDVNVILQSDNTGVIGSLELGRSRSVAQNMVIRRISGLLTTHSISITSRYVASSNNLADLPSRGKEPPDRKHSNDPLTLPLELIPFVKRV